MHKFVHQAFHLRIIKEECDAEQEISIPINHFSSSCSEHFLKGKSSLQRWITGIITLIFQAGKVRLQVGDRCSRGLCDSSESRDASGTSPKLDFSAAHLNGGLIS